MSVNIAALTSRLLGLRRLRAFSRLTTTFEKALPPRPKIDENELIENFVKGTGPGGQKINKTSSAVQLKHIPTGIVVKSQATRSREQNRKYARQLLAEKLDELAHGSQSRTAIKIERARAKKASADKKAKRKYKKLDEAKRASLENAEADRTSPSDSGDDMQHENGAGQDGTSSLDDKRSAKS